MLLGWEVQPGRRAGDGEGESAPAEGPGLDLLLKFLHNLFILDLGVHVVDPKLAEWLGAQVAPRPTTTASR